MWVMKTNAPSSWRREGALCRRWRAPPLPLPRLLLRDGAADRLQRTPEWEVRPGPALLRPGWVYPVPVGWRQPSRSASDRDRPDSGTIVGARDIGM